MLVSAIFVGFGLVALGSGVWHLRRVLRLRRDGVRCAGVVAGREAGASGGLFPVIEYTTADGHRLRFIMDPLARVLLPMHKRVPVRHSAANKANAVVDTFIGTWGQPAGLIVFGIALLALAPFASD